MIKVRSVRASQSHKANWYQCSHAELEQKLSKKEVMEMLHGLKNGISSVSNQTCMIAQGLECFGMVSLRDSYQNWLKLEKPLAAVQFNWIEFVKN
ncbi:hypothetical protein D6U78_09525 [Vibrio cholerae]|nr:hypothetical protein [Vibrio cholerae]